MLQKLTQASPFLLFFATLLGLSTQPCLTIFLQRSSAIELQADLSTLGAQLQFNDSKNATYWCPIAAISSRQFISLRQMQDILSGLIFTIQKQSVAAIERLMLFHPLFIIINTMLKSASNTLIILLILTLAQSLKPNHYNLLRALPSKFENAELINTPKNLLLKLTSGEQVKLLNVPDVYQFYNYSSGHSCLQAIFAYYQFPDDANRYRETQFISDNDFDQNLFATPQKIIEAAQRKLSFETLAERQNVFDLRIQQNLTQRDIEDLVQKGVPPILLITKNRNTEYGSYVVFIGHDKENYYLEDPFKLGSIAYLPKQELDAHWRSVIAYKQVRHLAITIEFKDHRSIQEVPLVRPSP